MKAETFVVSLKEVVSKNAEREVQYYAKPESPNPPKHLARFSAWYRSLAPRDRKTAREVIKFAAEGSLFSILTYLDNIALLTDEEGNFQLWHITEGRRTLLNDPDGPLLSELFNSA